MWAVSHSLEKTLFPFPLPALLLCLFMILIMDGMKLLGWQMRSEQM